MFHGISSTHLRRFASLLGAIAKRERVRIFGTEANVDTTFHRWVLRLSISCLQEIVLSGSVGMTRNALGSKLNRHERSIRRAMNMLIRNGYIWRVRYEAGKFGGKTSDVFVATKKGVEWLNAGTGDKMLTEARIGAGRELAGVDTKREQ